MSAEVSFEEHPSIADILSIVAAAGRCTLVRAYDSSSTHLPDDPMKTQSIRWKWSISELGDTRRFN